MKFKDVAHLYLGCRMVNESVYERSIEQGKPYKPHLFKMVSNDGSFWVSREQDSRNLETTPLKPILRRLEDLTEEHFKELFQMCYMNIYSYKPEDDVTFGNVIRMYRTSGIKASEPNVTTGGVWNYGLSVDENGVLFSIDGQWMKIKQAPLLNRLLSFGYDLFGLIDSGEAIDANTLEETK